VAYLGERTPTRQTMPGPAIASLRPLSRSSTFSLRCSEYEMRGIAPASFARSAELAPPTMGRWRSPSLVYRPSAVAGAVGSRVIQRTMPFGVSPRTPLPPRHPPLHTNAYDCDAGCIWGVGGWFREALI